MSWLRTIFVATSMMIVLAVVLTTITTSAQADVLYREIFPVAGGNAPLGQGGWKVNTGPTGIEFDVSSTADNGYTIIMADAAGLPTDLPAVNSNPQAVGEVAGYVYHSVPPGTTENMFFWTEEVTAANVDRAGLSEVSWYAANNDGSAMRAALKVGGQWYVRESALTAATGGGMNAGAQQTVTDFSSADWNALTFSPGVAMSRDTTSMSLPNGVLQAAGIYWDITQEEPHRFDTFEIQGTAIPEPSTVALCVTGLIGLLAYARRRRR